MSSPLSHAMHGTEQSFFTDPALDRAVGMIFTLAAEVFVANDRIRSLEVLLQEQGILKEGALDSYQPSAEEAVRLRNYRDTLVRSLLEVVKGEEMSLSASPEVLAS